MRDRWVNWLPRRWTSLRPLTRVGVASLVLAAILFVAGEPYVGGLAAFVGVVALIGAAAVWWR